MIDYFRVLEEESIRDNFVIVYELMDEMMDFGYPQHTDSQLLKKYTCVRCHGGILCNMCVQVHHERKPQDGSPSSC